MPTRTVSIRRKRTGLLGNYEVQEQAFDFVNWFKARRAGRNDSILATWESWEPKRFRLELESAKRRRRHRDEIARKNQELADILFDLLESSANEQIYVRSAISTAYLRLSNPHGYPGDHWIEIVDQDERLKWSDMSITYPERRSPLEFVLAEGESVVDEEPFTPEQAEKVYRFKAALKHRKGLWRRVEIQGGQTLADLDSILRDAFDHDSMDHLGGFWKLVRRGQSRRFREINLGDVHPFGGGGSAEDLRIAGLELQVGDRLKYVYDFGDWIEHEITLEAIDAPQAEEQYPLISDQNKPRYRYCESCKAEGRRTVATYICIDCSNEEQRMVLVCEDCLEEDHEDHYADETIY